MCGKCKQRVNFTNFLLVILKKTIIFARQKINFNIEMDDYHAENYNQ